MRVLLDIELQDDKAQPSELHRIGLRREWGATPAIEAIRVYVQLVGFAWLLKDMRTYRFTAFALLPAIITTLGGVVLPDIIDRPITWWASSQRQRIAEIEVASAPAITPAASRVPSVRLTGAQPTAGDDAVRIDVDRLRFMSRLAFDAVLHDSAEQPVAERHENPLQLAAQSAELSSVEVDLADAQRGINLVAASPATVAVVPQHSGLAIDQTSDVAPKSATVAWPGLRSGSVRASMLASRGDYRKLDKAAHIRRSTSTRSAEVERWWQNLPNWPN